TVPFIGCNSDGQVGPVDAPKGTSRSALIGREAAQKLAYYKAAQGVGVLHPREVIEHALAHGLPNKAEAAYARGTLLQKRSALMADWSAFCCPAHVGRAVPLSRTSPNDSGPQKTGLRRRTAR